MDYGIIYSGEPPALEGYSDLVGSLMKGITLQLAFRCLFIGEVSFHGPQRRKTCIANFNMSSEFILVASAASKAEWLRNLMFEILLLPKHISLVAIHADCMTVLGRAYSQLL